jgi:hypothetical protein
MKAFLLVYPRVDRMDGYACACTVDRAGRDASLIFASQGTPGKDRAIMMRTPQFKLTRVGYDDGGGEAHDLAKDPDESDKCIDHAAYSSTCASLTGALEEWEHRHPLAQVPYKQNRIEHIRLPPIKTPIKTR